MGCALPDPPAVPNGIVNRSGGKCLEVTSGSTVDGANVQWTWLNDTRQQWTLHP
jgi:hypothetical protein